MVDLFIELSTLDELDLVPIAMLPVCWTPKSHLFRWPRSLSGTRGSKVAEPNIPVVGEEHVLSTGFRTAVDRGGPGGPGGWQWIVRQNLCWSAATVVITSKPFTNTSFVVVSELVFLNSDVPNIVFLIFVWELLCVCEGNELKTRIQVWTGSCLACDHLTSANNYFMTPDQI